MASNNSSGGMSISMIVFIIFLTLKLLNVGVVADWSWWWVTAPLWFGLAIWLVVFIVVLFLSQIRS